MNEVSGAPGATGGSASLPEALTGLLGEWYGDGVGSSPSAEAGFRFVAQVSVTLAGPNLLQWRSNSTDATDGDAAEAALALTESGFWRWDPQTERVEVVLSRAAGAVVVLDGAVRPDPRGEGAHVELASEVVAHTATGEPASGERRLYSRRGDVLLFAVDRKQRDGELVPRASGALHPRS